MKKIAVVLVLIVFSLAILLPFSLTAPKVQAQTTNYSIQSVFHDVRVLHSGQIVIRDTIQISGQIPNSFSVGFPFQYSSSVIESEAYDSNNKTLSVSLGGLVQGQSGFYGATIDLSNGASNSFTVVFILSNALLTPTLNGFYLEFPAYPSLTSNAGTATTNLTLPFGCTINSIAKDDGETNSTIYTKDSLVAFTNIPGNATFTVTTGYIQEVTIPTLNRNIEISSNGVVTYTDKYQIINNSTNSISSFKLNLPPKATNVAARDQFGRVLSVTILDTVDITNVANVTFVAPVGTSDIVLISLSYNLPSITPQQSDFILAIDLYPYFNYYVNQVSTTITIPEGATIVSPKISELDASSSLTRSAFQETLTVNREGITFTDRLFRSQAVLQVTYNYNPLWIAFRPTIWMWVLAIIGVIAIAILIRPRTKTVPIKKSSPTIAAVGLSSDQIRTFVDAYDEKIQLNAELKSLEARVQKGRIPRRRYKLQRNGIENRISILSKTLSELKEALRSTGGSHADIIRQLDVAEVDAVEVDQELVTLENRHRVGEISLEDYKKQLADIEQRKEKTQNKISGLLLRLRGEIS